MQDIITIDDKITELQKLGFNCQKQKYPYEDIVSVSVTEKQKQEMVKSYEKLMQS